MFWNTSDVGRQNSSLNGTHEENRVWFKKYHLEGGRFTALDNEDILSDFSEYMSPDASI